ncbi:hypothetical protein SDC9_193613 [bioreactor metagenome]|uniref:Uncharacterized protein n=1 Tax=bioreactor metagenome TaxID=1076179 RepID=A0A645ICL5_9ZZZZ
MFRHTVFGTLGNPDGFAEFRQVRSVNRTGGDGDRQPPVAAAVGIEYRAGCDGFQVILALAVARPVPRPIQRGKQDRGKDGDDGDYDQQLDQCKRICFFHIAFSL